MAEEEHQPTTPRVGRERRRPSPGDPRSSALEEWHPAARTFATERFVRVRTEVAERVRYNQRTGRIRADDDPMAAAALMIAASDGLQTQWLLDPDVPQDAAIALLDQLLSEPSPAERPAV